MVFIGNFKHMLVYIKTWLSPGGEVLSQVELGRSDPCLPVSSHIIPKSVRAQIPGRWTPVWDPYTEEVRWRWVCWMLGLLNVQFQRANVEVLAQNRHTRSRSRPCYCWCSVV